MKIYLCDLCGAGLTEEDRDTITLDTPSLKAGATVYHVCIGCADQIIHQLRVLSDKGRPKIQKVVAMVADNIDSLY